MCDLPMPRQDSFHLTTTPSTAASNTLPKEIRTQFLQLKERGEKCRVFRLRETTMRGGLLVPP
jgi:hypothetical protein